MSAPDKKNLSPFGLAALALDAEFVELERLSGQIERIAIESDSGLERAQSLLIKFAECGQRVADGVIAFSKALQDAHVRAEKAGQTVWARAAVVRERQEETDRMLERFQMLSALVGKITGASVINCCYAARDIGISSTVDENVDLPNANMTLIDFKKVIADEKISLNVNLRLVSPVALLVS
jgi:hypothetical protein